MTHADSRRTSHADSRTTHADERRTTYAWDGASPETIAERCGVPRVALFAELGSTLDVAHELAEGGAPAGTLVVADAQSAGRGRFGRAWSSEPGRGIWCTMVERPREAAIELLSIRVGLRLAAALDAFAGERVGVKWPNDIVLRAAPTAVIPRNGVPGGYPRKRVLQFSKLGGILAEARWSGGSLAWVAIGVGINVVRPPPVDVPGAAGLRDHVRRLDVLTAVVSAVRSAAASAGPLTRSEIAQYAERDALRGRRLVSPAAGVAVGVAASGALLVETARGIEEHRAGTIRLAEES